MERSTQLLLFGDQTTRFEFGLRQLLKIKGNAALTTFLERTCLAIRHEVARLSLSDQGLFPRFTSITDLVIRCENKRNAALESVLMCIYQLGCFINYYGESGRQYPLPEKTHALGLCTGLLAAAAVSSSQSLSELLPAAVYAVLIALRTGLCVLKTGVFVDPNAKNEESWSAVIMKIGIDEIGDVVTSFCDEKNTSPTSRPYMSATSSQTVTISAPPHILGDFLSTVVFRGLKTANLPIHAPYHASHLYNSSDIDKILEVKSNLEVHTFVSRISISSGNNGHLHPAGLTYLELLRRLLKEILLTPLHLERAAEGFASLLNSSKTTQCNIITFASANTQGFITCLRQFTNANITIDDGVTLALRARSFKVDSGRLDQSKIAIVGFSGRFPDAANIEDFWTLLYKGLDVHRVVPSDRFDVDAHFDITGERKNTSKVRHGCWIKEPGLFDARFFNISPREAAQADPGQRLALQTTYEALEMAGIVPDRTPSTQRDRVGLFYGMTSDDWREANSGQNVDTYFIPGGNRAFTPGRINYYFKFSGQSLSVDTACSSSLAAIHLACNSLWTGDCDTAIAGGTNVMTNPDNFAGLDRGHFLSRTSNCNTFDDEADGYCRADGIGTVVLKRLEDALLDHDPVFGVILSAYTNHSAESVSITRPHVGAQQAIFHKLLNDAGLDPHEISYVEMHGTGTQAGDGVEMKSVLEVFAPDHTRAAEHPLHIGSAKANIGHGESASGVTSLIKVLMMMQKDVIPPHCGIKNRINQTFPTDLKERNVHIALKPELWVRRDGIPRRAFVNNFSAAGGNSALLLEDIPSLSSENLSDSRSSHLVVISAKSITSLQDNIQALLTYIRILDKENIPNFLSKLSYTSTARRIHYPYRVAVSGANIREVRQNIENQSAVTNIKPAPTIPAPIGFVFTGQGAQYAGMGRHLYENFSQFRADILCFDKIAKKQGFPSILSIIDGSGAIECLDTLIIQLGTVCLEMAVARLWSRLGIEPNFVIGHSLGEYAALSVAGVLSASDTIYLCGLRAKLLQERCEAGTHGMLAVKAGVSTIKPHLADRTLEISCCNGPEEVVVSSLKLEIDSFYETISALGLKCTKLNVPYAFHSIQVDPILDTFKGAARGVVFHKPRVPLISTVTGQVITKLNAKVLGPEYLISHCRGQVKFMQGIQAARDMGLLNSNSIWIEVGPHPVCSSMIKSIIDSQVVTLPSLHRREDGWKVFTASLSSLFRAGFELNWDEYHRDFEAAQQVLQLPAYCWDNKNYWIQYEHNWTLTKGDVPPRKDHPRQTLLNNLTISVQSIIEKNNNNSSATVVMESDFSHPLLKPVAHGHKVNGVALCPSSLYADIAQTLGNYLLECYQPGLTHVGIDVCDMMALKPLIVKDDGQQLVRASMTADWMTKSAVFRLFSVDLEGNPIDEHANCIIRFSDCKVWEQEWERHSYLIRRSIQTLQMGVDEGRNHKVRAGMAYKLFESLVEYGQNYKAMQEIIMDSEQYEATAIVRFQAEESNFHRNPFWIDSLGHLTGFVMNANDRTPRDIVYVNHGWKSMKCLKKFSAKAQYRTYVKMQLVNDKSYAGDLYVLEEDKVIALYEGVKFQGIPRRVLNTILPPSGHAVTQAAINSKRAGAKSQHIVSQRKPAVTDVGSEVINKASPTSGIRTNSSIDVKMTSSVSVKERALIMLSEEIGLPVSELKDSVVFTDYGVDSLLSLTILGRFREELDIDARSSLFSDYPTVGQLIKYLTQFSVSESDSSSVVGEATNIVLTPADTEDDRCDPSGYEIMASVGNIIAEEIGLSISEICIESNLSELGMDSLLSLTVLGRLREELEMNFPADFFNQNPTLRQISEALAPQPKPAKANARFSTKAVTIREPLIIPIQKGSPHPPATSILLQGNPKIAKKKLFLFPDGSGSATSYASLLTISSDVCVYGLNCPYMKTPENLTCSLDSLTAPYISEIRRRQPKGPYYLGGWSAGGICAFDAAQQLHQAGDRVSRLILLDSPNPIGISKLPPRLYSFFNTLGLFGSAADAPPPSWLLPHFLAFIDALDLYRISPFTDPTSAPRTHVLWATDGVCKNPGDPHPEPHPDDPREMAWLLENRVDFGPNGWDELVGGKENLIIETLEGVNHFEMMGGGKNGLALVEFLRRALA